MDMKLSVVLVSCLFVTASCVTVEAPKNLVSDSVNVAKDLYHSVKNELSENEDESNTFSVSYAIPANESHGISSGKCIDAAIEKAKKSLNKFSVDVKQTQSNIAIENGKSLYHCSVSV